MDARSLPEPGLSRHECGYFSVSPLPSRETLEHLYQHEYYVRDKPVYIEKTRRELSYWNAVWELRRQLIVETLGESTGRLLDVGSGPGFLLEYFRKRGWQVQGIEPSGQAARHARDELGLEIFEGFLEEFATDAPFDAIHCSLVLEHVREPQPFVARLAGLLRPGGVLFVEVPNDFNLLQDVLRDELDKPPYWVVPEHHLNYFDYESLARLLARYGLVEVDRLGSFPMELFVLMGMDYIGNDDVGSECHAMRMRFEKALLASRPEGLLRLYRALAQANLGRTCNLVARRT